MAQGGMRHKKAVLWIIVALVLMSFVALDLLFALRP
jgi:hypothetical protein